MVFHTLDYVDPMVDDAEGQMTLYTSQVCYVRYAITAYPVGSSLYDTLPHVCLSMFPKQHATDLTGPL